MNISGYNFLITITQKEYVGKLNGNSIYMIKQSELIPFEDNYQVLASLNTYLDGFNKLLNSGFYFSYNEDLS